MVHIPRWVAKILKVAGFGSGIRHFCKRCDMPIDECDPWAVVRHMAHYHPEEAAEYGIVKAVTGEVMILTERGDA